MYAVLAYYRILLIDALYFNYYMIFLSLSKLEKLQQMYSDN